MTIDRQRNAVSEFFAGTGLLLRGTGLVLRSPRLLLLGIVPGVISFVIVVAALVTLLVFSTDVATFLTWFADGWSADARRALRIVVAVAVVAGALILAVMTFTALTLTIGDPFYEAISKRIDDATGGARESDAPWHRTFAWNLVDSLRLLALSVATSVALFALGLVPVVGQTAGPVIGAVTGGWLLAVEISGVPFNRRGLRLRDRRRLLRANRALALGFGVPVFLVFLVPFVSVLVMPGAVAGSTLLARRVLGQPYE
ncbi:EI24 domain-containing protein [Planosporangium thailandense]|uniref:EI24 domain-containing protein n=1 Tax=Planosporangium thailandense TaxID=765197 RepID=UPI003B831885